MGADLMFLADEQGPERMPTFKTLSRGFWAVSVTLLVVSGSAAIPVLSDLQNTLAVSCEQSMLSMLLLGLGYALLLAIPFVPAVELGILIMILLGTTGILLVYACNLAGLSLSYLAGWALRHIHPEPFKLQSGHPIHHRMSGHLGKSRWCKLLQFYGSRVLQHPYRTMAVLINMPGNVCLGGGGGIAAFCGANREIRFNKFFLTMLVATSPMPILMLFGVKIFA